MDNVDLRSCGAILLILGVKVDTYHARGTKSLITKKYNQGSKDRMG